ncbi:MAG: anaerobic ribonucleoside-triphosphate reductase activating protein [Candidatus Aenigmarchaeota archaeon]|nr:anaerobic ribonucleoside-triphosphate reductase activating protein [Candidatus Aenigmarchaeota archaeon]
MLNFAGIVDSSTIDYPGKHCAVIYLCGCNFRCPYCHNKDLVIKNERFCKTVEISEIVDKIKANYLIDAVVITGGEPLLQKDTIKLIDMLKSTKLPVKIDTNLSFPDMLKTVINRLDFISVDIKADLDNYISVVNANIDIDKIKKSLEILKQADIKKEARTTIVPGLTDSKELIEKIGYIVRDVGFDYYTLQQFRPKNTLDPKYENIEATSYEKMMELGKLAKKILPNTIVRIATLKNGFEEIFL